MSVDVKEWKKRFPVIGDMSEGREVVWINPELSDYALSMEGVSVAGDEVEDAEARLLKFAPFIRKCFADTESTGGIIESPLREIAAMQTAMNEKWDAKLPGKLFLKMDSELAVAGSVKARGGIYEILKYAEELALGHGKIKQSDNYERFAEPELKAFFSNYSVHAGSTGNLGLSIGIISAALGFRVNVHMSADAKQWKKDLLRSKGVNVVEYTGDYGKAVKEGRALARQDPMSYFVDDENSKNLFLGYATAAGRLKKQLEEQNISVDDNHPLFVYIPCGVGGAPGGITFGLKQIYQDNVYIFFVEPTEACCMALGMITGLHNDTCVQDIGLNGHTAADGLAVARPSKFVGKTVRRMLAGEFTIEDWKLYLYMKELMEREQLFIEPSSCAAFEGPAKIGRETGCIRFLEEKGLADKMENSTHIVWATGGSLVPEEVRRDYFKKIENHRNGEGEGNEK